MLLATVDSAIFKPLASLQPLRQKTRNSVAGISWILMACHECVKKWLLRSMAVSDLFLLTLYSLLERHILENYKSLTFYSMNSMISMYSMSHSSHSLPTSKLMWLLTIGICRSRDWSMAAMADLPEDLSSLLLDRSMGGLLAIFSRQLWFWEDQNMQIDIKWCIYI